MTEKAPSSRTARPRRLLLATAALSMVSMAACDPCPQACALEGRTLERCLSDWELTWQDFDADSRQDYVLTCRELARDDAATTAEEDDQARRTVCVERQAALAGAADCAAARDALDTL